MCCKKRAPTWKAWAGFGAGVLVPVPAGMDEVLWVIHAPRSQGGAGGGGFGPKPRLAPCEPFPCSPSQRVLPSPMALGALLRSLSAC